MHMTISEHYEYYQYQEMKEPSRKVPTCLTTSTEWLEQASQEQNRCALFLIKYKMLVSFVTSYEI